MCSAVFCAGLPVMEDFWALRAALWQSWQRPLSPLSKDGYPELEEKSVMILKVLSEEEEKF